MNFIVFDEVAPIPINVWRKFMSRQEVYKSSTLGEIPLSFTGRHLLQNLRDAMTDLVAKIQKEAHEHNFFISVQDWAEVSKARGRIAQYMSGLEDKRIPEKFEEEYARHYRYLPQISDHDLIQELERRLATRPRN